MVQDEHLLLQTCFESTFESKQSFWRFEGGRAAAAMVVVVGAVTVVGGSSAVFVLVFDPARRRCFGSKTGVSASTSQDGCASIFVVNSVTTQSPFAGGKQDVKLSRKLKHSTDVER